MHHFNALARSSPSDDQFEQADLGNGKALSPVETISAGTIASVSGIFTLTWCLAGRRLQSTVPPMRSMLVLTHPCDASPETFVTFRRRKTGKKNQIAASRSLSAQPARADDTFLHRLLDHAQGSVRPSSEISY